MGLIQALLGAAGSTLADQWKEYFYCEAIPADTLITKGKKKVSSRSSNTKGSDNVISNGSVIAVADGQCMIIVDQGKIAEVCAEPGEFKYDSSTEPSIFAGNLGESIIASFKEFGKRFTFGGETPKDQRVYYVNTKEIMGNKYGTPSPVPFRVVDERAGLDFDASVRCFGEYSYKITDPGVFYTKVCGNISGDYNRTAIDSQLKTELLTALQPAFARISEQGIRYSALPGHTRELADALNAELSKDWKERRGIEIASIGVSSIKASEEDEAHIKEYQLNAAFVDPKYTAAHTAKAQMEAMKEAAKNPGGAAIGFMGMNMAQNAAVNPAQYYQMSQQQSSQQPQSAPAADTWKCPACGSEAAGKFCPECGAKKPEAQSDSWKCPACGAVVSGKFCPECGAKKPEDGWTCSCGKVNKGKFCSECGAKKPAGEPLYKCDKCGWEPEDPKHPPKFCPECGDVFDTGDIVG